MQFIYKCRVSGMMFDLPATTKHAESVAKLATGVGSALAAIWFPPAALAQPIIDRLIERYIKKPEEILIQAVRENGINILSDSQFEHFVPMAYRFFEAAKQGDYEHNLKLLGEFISSELKEERPEAARLLQVADCLSGMTEKELRIFAWVHKFIENPPGTISIDEKDQLLSPELKVLRDIIEPTVIASFAKNNFCVEVEELEDTLFSISNRGFIHPVPSFDMSRPDHTAYRLTHLGREILHKAKNSIRKRENNNTKN